MRNPYRRTDVFRCRHESHARFGYAVSAYHVLRSKQCFPHGCVSYRWFCHRFAKGNSCVRGFHHVGRLCVGCTYYRDTRTHYQPEVMLPPEQFRDFLEQVEEFEDWFAEHRYDRLDVLASVSWVRPQLRKVYEKSGSHLLQAGFLVRLHGVYLGVTAFEDPIYLHLSAHQQKRLALCPGDTVELRATPALRGSQLFLTGLSQVSVVGRDEGALAGPDGDEALVKRLVATPIPPGAERCLSCTRAVLVDVEFRGVRARGPARELYCLEGVQEHALCIVPVLDRLQDELFGLEECGEGDVLR